MKLTKQDIIKLCDGDTEKAMDMWLDQETETDGIAAMWVALAGIAFGIFIGAIIKALL